MWERKTRMKCKRGKKKKKKRGRPSKNSKFELQHWEQSSATEKKIEALGFKGTSRTDERNRMKSSGGGKKKKI